MDKRIESFKFELILLEDQQISNKEMIKMNKSSIFISALGGVLVCGMQIFLHDIEGSPIKMFNIISTGFFITATYHLFMQSLSGLSKYKLEYSSTKNRIKMLQDLINSYENEMEKDCEDNKE